jgi:hypothetical protein
LIWRRVMLNENVKSLRAAEQFLNYAVDWYETTGLIPSHRDLVSRRGRGSRRDAANAIKLLEIGIAEGRFKRCVRRLTQERAPSPGTSTQGIDVAALQNEIARLQASLKLSEEREAGNRLFYLQQIDNARTAAQGAGGGTERFLLGMRANVVRVVKEAHDDIYD